MTIRFDNGMTGVRPDTERWRKLQSFTVIDMSSPSAESVMYMLLLPEAKDGFLAFQMTANGQDLIDLLQAGTTDLLQALLQQPVAPEQHKFVDGGFDASQVQIVAELLGQPYVQTWQGCTLQNFATALVGGRQFQDNIRRAFQYLGQVDGGMLLYPNEGDFFPPSVVVHAKKAPEGQDGYGIRRS